MSDKIMDWAGEKVERDDCMPCTKHPDCFACVEGCCTALRMPDGRQSKKKPVSACVFYLPVDKAKESAKRGYQRLKKLGRKDLIDKYAKSLIATGAMDEEIQEATLQAESFERFREANYSEQLEKAMEEAAGIEKLLSPVGA